MNAHSGLGFMQKRVGMALGVLLAVAYIFLTPLPAQAADESAIYDGITYEVYDGESVATVNDYDEVAGGSDPVIRANVNVAGLDYPVTTIAPYAFSNKQITSVQIPDSVITIANAAFTQNNLTTVTIPNSVTSIHDAAFSYNNLTTVTIPDSVTSIGNAAFSQNNLDMVNISNSVTSIGNFAFSYNDLTTVVIPDSVQNIGGGAFAYNDLTAIDFPSSLTVIQRETFSQNKLTEVVIPDGITTIDEAAFSGNPMTRIEIASSVQEIQSDAFKKGNGEPPAVVFFTGFSGIASPAVSRTPNLSNVIRSSFDSYDTLYYYSERGADRISGGFTTPTWQGYNTVPVFKVNFETNGGSTIAANQETVRVIRDQFAAAPAPTRTGYSLAGWANTLAPGVVVNLATTPITADTTFTAVWNSVQDPAMINTGTSTNSNELGLIAAGLIAIGVFVMTRSRKKHI